MLEAAWAESNSVKEPVTFVDRSWRQEEKGGQLMAGRRSGLQVWVLGSAAVMVLGSFGPWIKALGQSISGVDGSNDGWLVIALATIGGLLFYASRSHRAAGVWATLGGAGGLAITIHDRSRVQHAIDHGGALTKALASVGWGLNVALIASGSMVLSGLISLAQTRTPQTHPQPASEMSPPSSPPPDSGSQTLNPPATASPDSTPPALAPPTAPPES
jgi:hypothetical protein